MNAETLLALAERVEKAEDRDRELDALIRCAVLREYERAARPAKRLGTLTAYYDDGGHSTFQARDYTSSLDAAMTLVPEGFRWRLDYSGHAFVWRECPGTLDDPSGPSGEARAATPALALTAAALRALASDRREMAEKALLGGRG